MNVFEFFGCRPDLREKPFQLVKHFEYIPASKIAWPMYCQEKKDGVFAALCVNESNDVGIFGRSGKELSNLEHVKRLFPDLAPGVYISEICNELLSLEELSGILNPNRVNPLREDQLSILYKMTPYFHDFIPVMDFLGGRCDIQYTDRYKILTPYIPMHLLLRSTLVISEMDARCELSKHLRRGHEGIVLKRDSTWVAGHKGWRSMKLVSHISYDLLCTGYEEGKEWTKREGQITNLIFKWKSGKIKADLGKGWTDSLRTNLDPIGKVFKVTGLKDSSKGKIRLPKVEEERIDKDKGDF